ncbi:hypothetical protein KPL76_08370 [Subtercola sp. PAMC28395]|uniref:hypothetical protein n=1 Tax=Subtercola sp. PAMC28395 TaxID=2846775 RepID=UPI001C0BB776|nr:hypothetical protein [Subtercola sp. PAMC28395]QWT22816.1 hypothetical protein KPL76_08370 [Subtercola sp. PAMC28395]
MSELLLDRQNARLGDEVETQQATIHALATHQGRRLVKLAESIVSKGLDPAQLFSVMRTTDKKPRYVVLEGNRRTLALKALETPTIVQAALTPTDFKKLSSLSDKYQKNPIEVVHCVLYEPAEAPKANEFVMSRHGGAQDGVGLVEWGAEEKDRYRARHGGNAVRAYSGQVIDFLAEVDGPSESTAKIATNVQRLMGSTAVRELLGLTVVNKQLVSSYPKDEIAKALRKIAGDLRSKTITVPNIYDDELRKDYLATFTKDEMPDPGTKLLAPVNLIDLPKGDAVPVSTPAPTPKKPKIKPKPQRVTVAASDAKINPSAPRTNDVYQELVTLNADKHPNASSVLFRVFVELSIDDYLARHNLMSEETKSNTPLAKRLKDVNDHLYQAKVIPKGLHSVVQLIGNNKHGLAASMVTFNQYVHNSYAFPKPSELRTSWDELQPFLEAVWK